MAAGYLLVVRDDVLLAQQVDESGTLEEASRYHWRDHDWRTNLFVASPRIVLSAAASARARELAWFDSSGLRIGHDGRVRRPLAGAAGA